MQKINTNKTGLAVGLIFAIWHAMWVMLVYTGYAQSLLDWILKMHLLHFEYHVEPFVLSYALTLIAVTALIGYVSGCIFALIWNFLHLSAHRK